MTINAECGVEGTSHVQLALMSAIAILLTLNSKGLVSNLPQCLRVIPRESSLVTGYTFSDHETQGKPGSSCPNANGFLTSRKECGAGTE